MLNKFFIFAALCLIGLAMPARAEDNSAPRFDTGNLDSGDTTTNARPKILDSVGIDQHLNEQLPMDVVFTDETGQSHKLGDYFGQRPVLLQIIQFGCEKLCTLELNGMCRAANGCALQPGRDYDILTISFDAREKPALGMSKKMNYTSQINRDGVAAAWHFLTGSQASIDALTKAVGFRYAYDAPRDQFVHAGALMIVTPDGRLSKYLYGAEYAPNDLRLSVADAGQSKIGSLSESFLLYCFHYDPDTGKYTVAVRNLLRLFAGITLTALVGFISIQFMRERIKKAAIVKPQVSAS
jgi:protein SCO1/2